MFRKFGAWLWNSLGNIVQITVWLGTAAVSAWAVSVVNAFSQYAPASWVAAGIAGGFLGSLGYWMIAHGRRTWVKTKYDNAMMARGGLVDPLANTFEKKRIYINEFVLPSYPHVEGKTFIDCDIVGPANIMLVIGNNAIDNQFPVCDAIPLMENETPYNAVFLRNCTFRRCSFQRITFLISHDEYPHVRTNNLFHWIGNAPLGAQLDLLLTPEDQNQPHQDTEIDTEH